MKTCFVSGGGGGGGVFNHGGAYRLIFPGMPASSYPLSSAHPGPQLLTHNTRHAAETTATSAEEAHPSLQLRVLPREGPLAKAIAPPPDSLLIFLVYALKQMTDWRGFPNACVANDNDNQNTRGTNWRSIRRCA
jgi:hypothetical protein